MKNFKFIYSTIIIAILSLTLFSCGKDSDDDGGQNPSGIEDTFVKIDVSGDINGSHEGYMSFFPFEFLGNTTWHLTGNDFNPQTFSIDFTLTDLNEALPEAGTYNLAEEPFFSEFIYIENEDHENPQIFTLEPNEGNSGTITIESINSTHMKGSFNFSAVRKETITGEVLGEVTVTGTFNALSDE